MIVGFIRTLDRIAPQIQLNYKGYSKYKTIMGGLISLIISLLTFALTIYYGRELFMKENPSIISSTIYNKMPSNTSLSPSNFTFYLAVEDPSNNLFYFKDDRIYEMTARVYKRIVTNYNIVKVEKIPIKLEACVLEKHFPGSEALFNTSQLDQTYCLRPEDNFFLKGDFDLNEFYEIQFYVIPCFNTTENKNKCKSPKEIESKLNSGYVFFKYGYYYYSPNNYSQPLTRQSQSFFSRIGLTSYKKTLSYKKKINFTSDNSIVFQEKDFQSFTQVDYIQDVLEPVPRKSNDHIWSMDLRMSYSEELHSRNYLKIQNLLAIVGGFYNGLFLISYLVVYYILSNLFWLDLINENFRFIDEINCDKSHLPKKVNAEKMKSSTMKNCFLNNSVDKQNPSGLNNNIASSLKVDDVEQSKLKFEKLIFLNTNFKTVNNKDLIKYLFQILFCCNFISRKTGYRNLFNRSKDHLINMLDISTIIKNQITLYEIKYLKLNEHESNLFKYIPKPNLRALVNEAHFDSYFKLVMNKEINKEQALKSLNHLINESKYSKILNLLE
jgi:hypothetical protein